MVYFKQFHLMLARCVLFLLLCRAAVGLCSVVSQLDNNVRIVNHVCAVEHRVFL